MPFALRSLLRSPVFALVSITTLALCIGANSAIFSVVNAILLKPYPWPGSEHLVYVHINYPKTSGVGNGISVPDYLDHREGVEAFAETALITGFNANLSFDGQPERVYGLSVTPSLFSLLQSMPAHGRAFAETDGEPGAPRTAVLTHAFWRARFGADPAAVGRTIHVNGEPCTIIGVMPEGFYFPSLRAQFFVPFVIGPEQRTENERQRQYSTMLARLRPDATIVQAQRQVDEVHRLTRERVPALQNDFAASGYGSIVLGFLEQNVSDVRGMLWLLQAGVAAALLIGCANVANLLLARAQARQREFAVRAALGAGRGRLVRLLLTETLLLFILGGVLGILVAWWSLSALGSFGVQGLPRGFAVSLDGRVVAFTLLCALGTGLAFGTIPALLSTRGNAADALRAAGTRTTAGRRQQWVRATLAAAQIALSLMLVATAGLLVRSFARLQAESPGFSPEQTLTASISLPAARYPTPEKRAAFAEALIMRLETLPGVSAAGLTNAVPFGMANPQGAYQVEGVDPVPGQPNPNAMIRQVSPGYFATIGIPLLRGRLLEPGDALGRENVVVIDRLLAEKHWPGQDPLGRRLSRGDSSTLGRGVWTVVGVVGTIKHWDLAETTTKETIYFPYAQTNTTGVTLLVRSTQPAATLASAIRAAVLAIDPDQPVFDLKSMEQRLDESLQRQRTPALLLGVFAAMAVILAALGIYGVLAYSVGQRTSEFGIRMALGADRPAILRLVLGQAVGIVAIGLAVGFAGYGALSSFIAGQLYGISAADPLTLVSAPLALATVALIACLLPARRATRTDPMVALRTE